jgi:hypothetical protein
MVLEDFLFASIHPQTLHRTTAPKMVRVGSTLVTLAVAEEPFALAVTGISPGAVVVRTRNVAISVLLSTSTGLAPISSPSPMILPGPGMVDRIY